ncbi:MAG: potassium/proton antiporter [Muribaculaceae bacterium]|nr:potassium/proton antiporter [Muribaculaceae bacterium]
MEHFTSENIILLGSVLLIVGVLAGKTSFRIGLPLLLIFLIVGMAFGTDGLGIQFGDMHTAQFIGMVALCIILFSGGMGTRLSAIRPVIVPGILLSTIGVLLTALLTGAFIWWLSGMEWTNIHFAFIPSLLLAATMSSTDSASVFGILGSRKVGLKNHLRPMLELESGSNDPMAYMLTIILIEAITLNGKLSAASLILQLLLQFGVGGLAGFTMGKITIALISFYRKIGARNSAETSGGGQDTSMISILAIGGAFLTFALTDALHGNGYLAVYLCGIVIGNKHFGGSRAVGKFIDSLTWLAQIVVFLMLGLLVNPHEMVDVIPVSLLIGMFIIVFGRPVSVFLSLAPLRKITFRSRLFVSWVGLRGAVPIIFATYPVVAQVQGASQIFNIVFFVTLLSLLIQGTSVISCARRLKLTESDTCEVDDFGVELSEEIPTSLKTIVLEKEHLAKGNTLSGMRLPEGSLVMMIRRGNRYLVPNGSRKLYPGDKLLIISEDSD